jgi:hypothetical protein
MTDFLEPCPSCNKQKFLKIEDRLKGRAFMGRVLCNSFIGGCGYTSAWYDNVKDVIINWNLRT